MKHLGYQLVLVFRINRIVNWKTNIAFRSDDMLPVVQRQWLSEGVGALRAAAIADPARIKRIGSGVDSCMERGWTTDDATDAQTSSVV